MDLQEFESEERRKRSFGMLERMHHQVLWELKYSGVLEDLSGDALEERFDWLWGSVGDLVRYEIVECDALSRGDF